MSHSENPTSKESAINDSIKLAIREEVENEVQKRIKRQEWFYYIILLISALGVYWYFRTFWNTEISEIPKNVHQQLETEGALAAQKEITNILSDAEQNNLKLNEALASFKSHADNVQSNLDSLLLSVKVTADNVSNDLNDLPTSMNTNLFVPIKLRLSELKRQDNVLVMDDLSKLFVHQPVTNLIDGNKIVLNYEPIPQTVRFFWLSSRPGLFYLDNNGYCDTNTVVLTNLTGAIIQQMMSRIPSGGVGVEYVRKSTH